MSMRALKTLLCAITIAAVASVAAQAADGKGGIEGKVTKVDAAKGSLTITALAPFNAVASLSAVLSWTSSAIQGF